MRKSRNTMRLRNKHDRDTAWERKHLEERIRYLEQQIGAHKT